MKKYLMVGLVGLSLVGCATTPGQSENTTGYYLLKNNELARAEPYFVRALEANPNDPYALTNLGFLYQKQGRFSESRAMYNRVINLRLGESNVPAVETGGVNRGQVVGVNENGDIEAGSETFNEIALRNLAALRDKVDTNTVSLNDQFHQDDRKIRN